MSFSFVSFQVLLCLYVKKKLVFFVHCDSFQACSSASLQSIAQVPKLQCCGPPV